MKLPQKSPDLASAIDNLHAHYGMLEETVLMEVDNLAKGGFSDKRWCAIARTKFEEAFMALHRALRDYPGADPQNYGKVPLDQPLPREFQPPVDPEPRRNIAPTHRIDWKDYSPGETLDPPDRPEPLPPE